ncbi:hypothetical protein HK099_008342, partial [Clydaea vesicula]
GVDHTGDVNDMCFKLKTCLKGLYCEYDKFDDKNITFTTSEVDHETNKTVNTTVNVVIGDMGKCKTSPLLGENCGDADKYLQCKSKNCTRVPVPCGVGLVCNNNKCIQNTTENSTKTTNTSTTPTSFGVHSSATLFSLIALIFLIIA